MVTLQTIINNGTGHFLHIVLDVLNAELLAHPRQTIGWPASWFSRQISVKREPPPTNIAMVPPWLILSLDQ
jgi:hypothetical protein